MKLLFRLAYLSLFIGFSSSAFAKISIILWQPSANYPVFVLPQKDHETESLAVKNTLLAIAKQPHLAKYLEPQILHIKFKNTQIQAPTQYQALLLANDLADSTSGSERTRQMASHLKQFDFSLKNFLVGTVTRLTHSERKEMYAEVAKYFSLLIAQGGDDIDPKLYKQKNLYAKTEELNLLRDKFQLEIISAYAHAQKGFQLGICRGHQLTAVALGYGLIQDISHQIHNPIQHQDVLHGYISLPTKNGLLASWVPKDVQFWSYHHQAVDYQSGGPLELAAIASDGVTESLEFKNGHGISFQFHPEEFDSTNVYSMNLFKGITDRAKFFRAQSWPISCCHGDCVESK